MKIAFLFDLEGVLFDTYPAYFKALLQSMLLIKKKYQLKTPLPTAFELANLVEDKPLHDVEKLLFIAYPIFQPYQAEIKQEFSATILQAFQQANNFLIEDSIALLFNLREMGFKLAVVTNCPRSLASCLIAQLKLNPIKPAEKATPDSLLLITPEEAMGAHKPDAKLYQVAAAALHEHPQNCVVFEDSLRGLEAAAKAAMSVILLKNPYLNDKEKFPYQPLQLVERLSQATLVKNLLTIPLPTKKISRKSTLEYHFLLQKTREEKEKLAQETYAIYRHLFIGRHYEQWLQLFFDSTMKDALLYLMRNEQKETVGFYLISAYEIHYKNQLRLVLKLYMGMLPSFQGSGIIASAYQHAGRYLSKKYQGMKIEIFENITGPVAYTNACRFFGNYLRPSVKKSYNEEDLAYLNYLLEQFNYHPLSAQEPFVVESQSCVFIDPILYRQLQNSANQDIQFFIKKTGLKPGVGLACLVDAIPGFFVHFRLTILRAMIKVYSLKIAKKWNSLWKAFFKSCA